MNPGNLTANAPGQCVEIRAATGEQAYAFLPNPLPPTYHPAPEVQRLNERAALALGNLRGSGTFLPNPILQGLLPDPSVLIYGFIGVEAAASTRIEGTRADFTDLVIDQAGATNRNQDLQPDIEEIRNYRDALLYGWDKPAGRPVTSSYLRELHAILLGGVRGQHRNPGTFRNHLVYIGRAGQNLVTARFVPPPPEQVMGLIENLTDYFQAEPELPNLIRLAVIHYQFETIHPFSDGNGRLGRLLMPLLLREWGYLTHPVLPLSEFFEEHRDEYIDLLSRVSTRGEWDTWIGFVLDAVRIKAEEASTRSQTLMQLWQDLRLRYQTPRMQTLIDALFERPTITVRETMGRTGLAFTAANNMVNRLVTDGVLEQATAGRRDRVFIAPAIVRAIMGR